MASVLRTEDDYNDGSKNSSFTPNAAAVAATQAAQEKGVSQTAYYQQQQAAIAAQKQAEADAAAQAEAARQAAAQQQAQQAAQAAAEKAAAEQAAQEEAQRKAEAEAAALRAQIEARKNAISSANSAIDQSAQQQVDKYNNSKTDVNNDYQKLLNQNSVRQYQSRVNQRESLANRGNLDSGLGRMENLQLNTTYGNNQNDILLKRQAELDNIANYIQSVLATASKQKADNEVNGLNDFNTALQNTISSTYSGYSPTNSDYYKAALATLTNGLNTNGYNSTTTTANESSLAAALKKQQDEDAYTKLLKAYQSQS